MSYTPSKARRRREHILVNNTSKGRVIFLTPGKRRKVWQKMRNPNITRKRTYFPKLIKNNNLYL